VGRMLTHGDVERRGQRRLGEVGELRRDVVDGEVAGEVAAREHEQLAAIGNAQRIASRPPRAVAYGLGERAVQAEARRSGGGDAVVGERVPVTGMTAEVVCQ